MPVPNAVIRVPICSELSILSKRARSTLSILPRSGSTAWNSRLRPCLALPPAESPSTMNSSDLAGSRSWQSARFPGSEVMPSALLRGFARGGGLDHLADDDLGFARVLLEPGLEHVVDDAFDRGAHLGGDQLVLGLRGEFRIRHLDGKHGGQAFPAIVAGQRHLLLARGAAGFGIAGDLARQRAAEAGQMRAAVALRNGVGEAEHALVVAVVPPH